MLRKTFVITAAAIIVSALTAAPASAEFSQQVGTSRCNITATGPTFTITTLPNPGVKPDGALGASVYCPV